MARAKRTRRSNSKGQQKGKAMLKKYGPIAAVAFGAALLARSVGPAWDTLAGNSISGKATEYAGKLKPGTPETGGTA